MLFRRIIVAALVVGVAVGLLLGVAQHYQASQIIYAAEVFEGGGEAAVEAHAHEGGAHLHKEEAWAPEDGAERIFYTVVSGIFVALGFSALMLVFMCLAQLYRPSAVTPRKGLLWGLAGFAMFFAAPSLGLPPEIPGMEAAAIGDRRLWWLFAVLLTGAGLALLAFAPGWKKLPGLLLLLLPHLAGAPHMKGAGFLHPDPAAVQALEQLHQQFIVATTLTNAAFWVLLGLACAWAVQHWVLKHDEAIG
jgi:cobalt transporter subunit CbtA